MSSGNSANNISRSAMITMVSSLFVLLFGTIASLHPAVGDDSVQPLFGLSVRNDVIEKRFKRTRNEQKAVSKLLMNSNVTGSQSTVTETTLRIVPDEKSLRFELQNSGDVTSQTTGFNQQATVDSVGNHHFEITKPMWFDGNTFLTLPAYGTIQASQTPQRVVSAAGAAMPLLGPLSDRVAWNEVMRRTPEINQVVAEDVSRDVLPKVNKIVDEDFAKLQEQWKTVQQRVNSTFRNTKLQWHARSTGDSISLWTQDASLPRTTAVAPVPNEAARFRETEAVVLFISEATLSTLLDQYFPAGLKLTDTQLQNIQLDGNAESSGGSSAIQRAGDFLSKIARLPDSEPNLFTLEFAPKRPVEIRFVEGDVRLITTFQIHPKVGASSGWMTTSFNLRGKRFSDDEWAIAVRSVDVGEENETTSEVASEINSPMMEPIRIPSADEFESTNTGTSDQTDDAITTVEAGTAWIPIVRNAAKSISEKIPPVRLPLEFDSSDAIPGSPRFRLGKIDSANGMLRIGLRIVADAPTSSVRQKQ